MKQDNKYRMVSRAAHYPAVSRLGGLTHGGSFVYFVGFWVLYYKIILVSTHMSIIC